MSVDKAFGAKLTLALQALTLSRGRAAALLGVDKSLVGRWASGAVTPTDHNLSRLTEMVAARIEGFSMLDWHRDLPDLAALLGVDPELAPATPTMSDPDCLPLPFLEQARSETRRRHKTYEGFWRTSRASVMMGGRIAHDHGLIRAGENGLLEVWMGSSGLSFRGWAFLLEGNLFAILHDTVGCTPLFLVFRGVTLPRATRLDGILTLAALDASRTPAAIPILLERIGDLSGDRGEDEQRFREFASEGGMADEDTLPGAIRRHLVRDIGPVAAAAGGELFLTAPVGGMSRGISPSGELEG